MARLDYPNNADGIASPSFFRERASVPLTAGPVGEAGGSNCWLIRRRNERRCSSMVRRLTETSIRRPRRQSFGRVSE